MEMPRAGWKKANHAIGWVALSLYAFAWLIHFDLSRAAESVFVLCFIIAWCTEPAASVKWNRVFLLLLSFVVLQAGVHVFAVARFPDFADEQVKAARHFTKLFLCIAVAWWLRGSMRAARYLLWVFLAGFLVSLAFHSTTEAWAAALAGRRVDFGYTNAQHSAFYLGLVLIMGGSWLARCLQRRVRGLEWVPALVVTLLGLVGVVVTQTRAVWLALAIVLAGLLLVGLVYLFIRQGDRRALSARGVVALVVVASTLAVAGYSLAPIFEKRLEAESTTIQALEAGDVDEVSIRSSIGVRLHTWWYAWERVQERPLTGWGAKSRNPLIDEGDFPGWVKRRFGHFHNSYLEILLAYGALGMLALALLTGMILKGTHSLLRSGQRQWGLGLLSAWAFFFVVNVFESYLIFSSGMYFYIIVGGVGMSFYLFGARNGKEVAS
ncbi:O-antigen ligase [Halomonas sp. SL1]|uniref:O-antigen ligase family protein n=1 Tax=Halomonas sp. SL1 TaxID=2137478 RepID=UPI000D16E162|nr:O-antigen ligase family protein [Halomonas sp. SL1]RAH38237.1 O-antigen ligase family protein [Halomonas sp. SL1]